jgi:hypothetical protein
MWPQREGGASWCAMAAREQLHELILRALHGSLAAAQSVEA